MGGISWLAQCALDFLIDERCHACGVLIDDTRTHAEDCALAAPLVVFSAGAFQLETRLLCAACAGRVVAWPGPVYLPPMSHRDAPARVYPAFVADERLLVLIRLLKFARRARIAPWLAAAMVRSLPDFSARAGTTRVVVPVPMDRSAQRRRGFNQAERIARALAAHWALDFDPRALIKIRRTKPQSTLGREARLANLEGAFRAEGGRVRGADIILVDDLVTTGATLRACAAALGAAGAREVVAVAAGYRDQQVPDQGPFPQS